MSVQVNTAMSGAAIAASSVAIHQARQAKKEVCKVTIEGFDSKNASIEQMKTYSECVRMLHPNKIELQGDSLIFAKSVFVIALIGMIIGATWFFKEHGGLIDLIMGGILGFLLLPLGLCGLLGLVQGIIWLFN